ncbi:hypothetical protein MWU58_01190 [Flavobacteriaceae bacterium S0825]|uniref:hypothetical protein n=1 Tax=Gaetbulibacter sp. S0825 TaxID=2720084 RepID=UPI0014305403|nr:hypothetical protein [Gaetbulibacter sp. S0825]MCK0107896.1 hypothetical protein [Flavobacteriaceae bacterium S0825]NIX63532.1 hypothetical protein [Gaetbulibacter sp. S0825]
MLRFIYFLFFITFGSLTSNAQSVSFSPEIVIGNRSAVYQHFVGYKFNNSWSINNVSLFDTEYINNKNNMFFIRNMLSYNLNKNFKANAAIGLKNPGAFATLTSQYQYNTPNFKISYAIGSTYQNGFTLEQTLILNYTPKLSKTIQGYINLFAVVNTNLKVLDRGIQQLRIGIKKEKLITGIAANLDQFNKAEKTLENFGVFIKYNF